MIALLIPWVALGGITAVFAADHISDELSVEAQFVAGAGVFIVFPLLLSAAVIVSVGYMLPRTLYRGGRDLWRAWRPERKLGLARAKVVRK